jgi:Tfp pilus assembly protein PilZ
VHQPRFDTRIWTRFDVEGHSADGRIENAGAGGVFVRTRDIPERGDKVWLHFEGPSGELIEALGVVWWTTLEQARASSKPHGFGVRLLASNGAYRRLLSALAERAHPAAD